MIPAGAAQPKPESWQEIAREAASKCSVHAYDVYRVSRKSTTEEFERIILAAIERSHAEEDLMYRYHNDPRLHRFVQEFARSFERSHAAQPQPSKASPLGERSEPSVKDKVWSKIVTETGDMERADRVTSGKDTPSTFELLRPDQPPAKAADDKQGWTVNYRELISPLGNRYMVEDDYQTATTPAKRLKDEIHAAIAAEREHRKLVDKVLDNRCLQLRKMEDQLAAERQRNFDAEKELRDKARARIEELKSDLLSALAAIEKHNEDQRRNMLSEFIEDEPDLSSLREHDEKLTAEVRKPLVEALKQARAHSKSFYTVREICDDALAKAKP